MKKTPTFPLFSRPPPPPPPPSDFSRVTPRVRLPPVEKHWPCCFGWLRRRTCPVAQTQACLPFQPIDSVGKNAKGTDFSVFWATVSAFYWRGWRKPQEISVSGSKLKLWLEYEAGILSTASSLLTVLRGLSQSLPWDMESFWTILNLLCEGDCVIVR
jgi:hypothetical protein